MNNRRLIEKKHELQTVDIRIPPELENVKLPAPEMMLFYKDIDRRVFWIVGPIDDTLYNMIQYIIHWNMEDKGKPIRERTPIRIIIASGGGDLEVEKTVSSIIELSETPIYAIAIGLCASAASMIFLSCHKRYALPNATFVFHQGSCDNIGGTYQQVVSFVDNYAKDIEAMGKFYTQHTKYAEEVILDKLATGDWYIDTEEALENGVVDEIVNSLAIFL